MREERILTRKLIKNIKHLILQIPDPFSSVYQRWKAVVLNVIEVAGTSVSQLLKRHSTDKYVKIIPYVTHVRELLSISRVRGPCFGMSVWMRRLKDHRLDDQVIDSSTKYFLPIRFSASNHPDMSIIFLTNHNLVVIVTCDWQKRRGRAKKSKHFHKFQNSKRTVEKWQRSHRGKKKKKWISQQKIW